MRENSELSNTRENGEVAKREKKIVESHETNESGVSERSEKLKSNFFAHGMELKRAVDEKRQVILLVYKELFFSFEEPNLRLLSFGKSLSQEFEDVSSEDMTSRLSTVRGIECQIDFVLGPVILN